MTDYLSQKIKVISFIAIILVVFQHAINFTGYIDPASSYIGQINANSIFQYIIGYGFSRSAVALFFLLSGYLFFRNFHISLYGSKLWSRVRSLLVPYILWSSIGMAFIYMLQTIPGQTDYFSVLYTGRVIGQPPMYYIQSIVNHGVSFQLWFLTDLMLYALLAPIFFLLVRYTSFFVIVPLFILWLMQIPLPPFLSFLYRGGIFYLTGAFLAVYPFTIVKEKVRSIAGFAAASWLIILVIKTCVAFGVLPTLWLTLPHLDNMTIVMGIATIWFGYDVVMTITIPSWLTKLTPFTFFIYVSHEPLLEVLKRIGVGCTGHSDYALMALYILTIGMTLVIMIACGYLLRKFVSPLFHVLTGGR